MFTLNLKVKKRKSVTTVPETSKASQNGFHYHNMMKCTKCTWAPICGRDFLSVSVFSLLVESPFSPFWLNVNKRKVLNIAFFFLSLSTDADGLTPTRMVSFLRHMPMLLHLDLVRTNGITRDAVHLIGKACTTVRLTKQVRHPCAGSCNFACT